MALLSVDMAAFQSPAAVCASASARNVLNAIPCSRLRSSISQSSNPGSRRLNPSRNGPR